MTPIDLRSDTLTQPTEGMRRAMAAAEVGDDVYGEDPTVNRLEARAAEVLGKEAALFVPSGTMGNQLALLVHCRPGDEVVIGRGAHVAFYEGGAGAAWAGVQFTEVPGDGCFDADALAATLDGGSYATPRTRLVAFENTHNRAGGRVFPARDLAACAELARARGLAVHVDGARIWNAAVATGADEATLCAPVDTVSACFSKGLGAPVGSVLAGPREAIREARRLRKMLGGGMRQAGVLAAAALHALDHQRARLAEDHAHARRLAEGLAALPGVRCDPAAVETNLVAFDVRDGDAPGFEARARDRGVRIHAMAPGRLRAVTRLGIGAADVDEAVARLAGALC